MSILTNELRIGNFTSSEIHRLMSNGKAKDTVGAPFYSYMNEKKIERRLGRSIDIESSNNATNWGKLMEMRVFQIVGTEYRLCSSETARHSFIPFWSGSPDMEKFDAGKTAVDIKCPYTMLSFCTMIDAFERGGINAVRNEHSDGEKFYWQTVSNSIILDAEFGELLVYCPFKSELEEIREMAQETNGGPRGSFYNFAAAPDEELPHLIDGKHYKNLNALRFKIPNEDKDRLTNRVLLAGKLINL